MISKQCVEDHPSFITFNPNIVIKYPQIPTSKILPSTGSRMATIECPFALILDANQFLTSLCVECAYLHPAASQNLRPILIKLTPIDRTRGFPALSPLIFPQSVCSSQIPKFKISILTSCHYKIVLAIQCFSYDLSTVYCSN